MARKTDSNNPLDWLFIAASDLEGVCVLLEHEISHAMCVSKLAEILEKVIKAELIRSGWFLVKTHDLVKLVDELHGRQPELAERFQPLCEFLAERYFTDRYPGFDLDDPDWPELRCQVEEIESLLAAVKKRVDGESNSP
ncbi:MAG: HEPN domain-containing protein [Lentisphaeria bacterium]|nr:HEPN domain-containing protein [Lentisphaeria bacterium]